MRLIGTAGRAGNLRCSSSCTNPYEITYKVYMIQIQQKRGVFIVRAFDVDPVSRDFVAIMYIIETSTDQKRVVRTICLVLLREGSISRHSRHHNSGVC